MARKCAKIDRVDWLLDEFTMDVFCVFSLRFFL
jgi:hypothetical protein